MTQLLLAGENLAWSLFGLRGVGFLILFLFLAISGFFVFPGEQTMCAGWMGSPRVNPEVALLDQPFLYLLLSVSDPRFVWLLGCFP